MLKQPRRRRRARPSRAGDAAACGHRRVGVASAAPMRSLRSAAGRSAYDRGAWEEAARSAHASPQTAPTSTEAVRLLARSSARLGRDDSALTMFQRLDPDGLGAEDCFLLACICATQQPAAARAQLWKAARQGPRPWRGAERPHPRSCRGRFGRRSGRVGREVASDPRLACAGRRCDGHPRGCAELRRRRRPRRWSRP